MNYKESQEILEEIKKAKKILLSCHKSPDPDSVASNLAMHKVLKTFNKDVDVVSFDNVHAAYKFVPNYDSIRKVQFDNFAFDEYELLIALDSSSFDQLVGIKDIHLPKIPIITIDHHNTNEKYGFLNLLEVTGSTCEVLFRLFEDWKINIDPELATMLMVGVYADTVSFQTDNTKDSTFEIASKLIKFGADKQKIVMNLFHSNEYNLIKFWSKLLENMHIDVDSRFVWTAVPYESFVEFGKPSEAKSLAANILFRTIKDTDFGIVMIEQRPKVLNMSLRARTNFDVSKVANEFGGSGHKASAGAWFDFDNFDEAVAKVLETARKFAKEFNSGK